MKTYIFRGKEYKAQSKDIVLRINGLSTDNPKNRKAVKKIKTH